MAGNNQFKLFAGPSTNTYTPAEWAALTTLLTNGFGSGLASSQQANTLFRQLSTVAAGLAQFIANQNLDALDDGSVSNFASLVYQAVRKAALPSGTILMSGAGAAPSGTLKLNGSAVPINATTQSLVDATYCGDGNNGTADFFYKCTNPSSPSTSRSTAGTYFALEDTRGRFPRSWVDGGTLDVGRSLWSYQLDAFQGHEHQLYDTTNGGGGGYTGSGNVDWTRNTQAIVEKPGYSAPRVADETRPVNFPALFVITL